MASRKTIGIVEVAAFAASAAGNPEAAITSTFLATRSAASSGRRRYSPTLQRYSIETFWPSTRPCSASPLRTPAMMPASAFSSLLLR